LSKINVCEFHEDVLNHSSIFFEAFPHAQVTLKLTAFPENFNPAHKYSQLEEKKGRI
jgi:hypothetical protein